MNKCHCSGTCFSEVVRLTNELKCCFNEAAKLLNVADTCTACKVDLIEYCEKELSQYNQNSLVT
ncbi:MAG: hypothetical protein SFU98_19660 [Leptospiraceae bacterium]|nr:hypothetical protein [Leptospiraceae bacterium]